MLETVEDVIAVTVSMSHCLLLTGWHDLAQFLLNITDECCKMQYLVSDFRGNGGLDKQPFLSSRLFALKFTLKPIFVLTRQRPRWTFKSSF